MESSAPPCCGLVRGIPVLWGGSCCYILTSLSPISWEDAITFQKLGSCNKSHFITPRSLWRAEAGTLEAFASKI